MQDEDDLRGLDKLIDFMRSLYFICSDKCVLVLLRGNARMGTILHK